MVEKIARICYNEFGWTRPSGANGKGTLAESFEHKNSFGHEEWLFDKSRILKGYHYAFLQPMNGFIYAGSVFDVHLFIYSKSFGKLYLGVIHNVECLDEKEAEFAYEQYRNRGWIESMKADILAVGGVASALDNDKYSIFNIRFKFSDVDVNLSNPRIISQDDPSTRATYYKLYDKKGDFIFSSVVATKRRSRQGVDSKSEKRVCFNTDVRRTSYDPLHNRIQNAIKEILLSSGEYQSVTLEKNFVDLMAVTRTGETHYYEIKTSSAKASIREGIGQVMEYSYYPDEKRADKLVIVAPEPADEFDQTYMITLRDSIGLPIWFRYYSIADNTLSGFI